jgi:hypothetical protein
MGVAMIVRVFAASLLALLCGSLIETARADQSFMCDDGTLVQVAAQDLERMKRENQCVAKYFGGLAVTRNVPLPERKPATNLVRLRKTEPERTPDRPASYRMVRIINAGKDGEKWFHHRY